jgi:hypothetical protein
MTKHQFMFSTAVLATLALGNNAHAQRPSTTKTIRIQVSVSGQGATDTVTAETETVSVSTDPSGRFNVSLKGDEVLPSGCSADESAIGPPKRVSTKIEGLVRAADNDQFHIGLTVTDRSLVGCRRVGELNVPVFSNRILAKAELRRSGETIPLTLDNKSGGESLRIEIALVR